MKLTNEQIQSIGNARDFRTLIFEVQKDHHLTGWCPIDHMCPSCNNGRLVRGYHTTNEDKTIEKIIECENEGCDFRLDLKGTPVYNWENIG